MKRIGFILCAIFMCAVACATTYTQYWYVENESPTQTTCTTGGNINLPTAPTKYGYDFIGWEKLPYVPIEYIESTGTQYIDTGYIPNRDTYVELDLQFTSVLSVNQNIGESINGCRQTGLSNRFYPVAIQSNSGLRHTYGSTELYTNLPLNRHYVKFNDSEHRLIVDNVFVGTLSNYIAPTVSSRTFWVFRGNNEDIATMGNWFSRQKVYLLKLYDNNTLVRDFIPVLDVNGTPCMYDKVEGKFYYNAGTGDFIAGPVIGSGE